MVLQTDRPSCRTNRAEGAFILAANHTSTFDVPLIARHSRRDLDFVSITEAFDYRFGAWFFGSMNAFPINRSKPDFRGMRVILDRLKRQRAIAIFPEGHIRAPEDAIIHGGKIRPGTGRLAVISGAPIVPCVVVNSAPYNKIVAWLPHRRIRYGLIFGEAISVPKDLEKTEAAQRLERELQEAMIRLYQELISQMPPQAISSRALTR